jgi:hypothetical protein
MGDKRVAYVVLLGKPEGERPFGNPSVDSRIILNASSVSGMGAMD